MENKDIVSQNHPSVPGFGVSGLVMCPFFKGACLKGGCELWVELKQGDIFVARCSFAWLTILSTEVRGAIDKLGTQTKTEEGNNAST